MTVTEAELLAQQDADKQKVEFTPEQQAKVNELIQGAQGRAGREAKEKAAKLETELTTAKALLAEKEAALKSAAPGNKDEAKGDVEGLKAEIAEMRRASQGQADEVKRLQQVTQAKDNEVSEAKKEALNIKKQVAISDAASEIGFVNNNIVTKLTEDNISWDAEQSRFIVIGANGQPRLNSSFENMTLKEFYAEYASQNPYLVRGDVKGGTGSGANRNNSPINKGYEMKQIFGKESSSMLAQKLMKENPAEYGRLKLQARAAGIIA